MRAWLWVWSGPEVLSSCRPAVRSCAPRPALRAASSRSAPLRAPPSAPPLRRSAAPLRGPRSRAPRPTFRAPVPRSRFTFALVSEITLERCGRGAVGVVSCGRETKPPDQPATETCRNRRLDPDHWPPVLLPARTGPRQLPDLRRHGDEGGFRGHPRGPPNAADVRAN